ncbi:hypothetical protein PMEGAPR236_29490 [Priestia megaterium]
MVIDKNNTMMPKGYASCEGDLILNKVAVPINKGKVLRQQILKRRLCLFTACLIFLRSKIIFRFLIFKERRHK